jgi:hypothetical protein
VARGVWRVAGDGDSLGGSAGKNPFDPAVGIGSLSAGRPWRSCWARVCEIVLAMLGSAARDDGVAMRLGSWPSTFFISSRVMASFWK